MNSMDSRNRKIIDAVIRKEQAEVCPGAVTLIGICVREAARGKGIARKLMRACEEWVRQQGCAEFASDCELTNIESQGFHRAVGFEEANRIVAYVRKI